MAWAQKEWAQAERSKWWRSDAFRRYRLSTAYHNQVIDWTSVRSAQLHAAYRMLCWHVEKGEDKDSGLVPKTGGFSSAKPHLPLQLSKATHQLEESKVQRKAVCLWVMMEWWWKKSTAASSSAKEKGPPWLGESMVTWCEGHAHQVGNTYVSTVSFGQTKLSMLNFWISPPCQLQDRSARGQPNPNPTQEGGGCNSNMQWNSFVFHTLLY